MEIKEIIAKNITELRKYKKWTQMELAEKMNYTDKAISKWERAESTPDVDALYRLSEIFSVTVDYFFHEQKESKAKYILKSTFTWFKKMMYLFIVSFSFLLVALILFIIGNMLNWPNMWVTFIWCAPIIATATFIFFMKLRNWLGSIISCSCIPWCLLAGIYFQLVTVTDVPNLWLIFLTGIPVMAVIVLAFFKNFQFRKK